MSTCPSNGSLTPPGRTKWFRFTTKHLLIAVTLIGVLLAIWMGYFRRVMTCRPAVGVEEICERNFNIDEGLTIHARNVVILEGRFAKDLRLLAELSLLRSGQPTRGTGLGWTPHINGQSFWTSNKITITLASWDTPDGKVTELGVVGQHESAGYLGHSIAGKSTFAVAQQIPLEPGPAIVVYAEGDSDAVLWPGMTLEEFAEENREEFLVVAVRLY